MKHVTGKVISAALSASMLLGQGSTVLAMYENFPVTTEVSESEAKNLQDAIYVATESIVLLENNGVLPLSLGEGKKVALYGMGARNTVMGGMGSGAVPAREVINVYNALKDTGVVVTEASEKYLEASGYNESVGDFNGPGGTYDVQSFLTEETVEVTDEYLSDDTDTAIYVLSRLKGEGNERTAEKGDYYLSDLELANLKKIAAYYDNVIFVYNSTATDSSFFDEINREIPDGIDAMVAMGSAGQGAGEALRQILVGEVNPSGKLVTTWANSYEDYPASATFGPNDGDTENEIYEEGIYVGYRYFDTFGKDVAYEFGYGLSYTDFDMQVEEVTADQDYVTVKVKVTNTGKMAGKEVAQVYFSAPNEEGKAHVDKPFQELIAYAKTDLLQPGESQELAMTFMTTEMSSYDEELAAYILDNGSYKIRVGNSSRNTRIAAVLNVDAENGYQVTEQLSNQLQTTVNEENRDTKNETGYLGDKVLTSWDETAVGPVFDTESAYDNAVELALDFSGYEIPDNTSEYEDHIVTTYVAESNQADYEKGLYWGETLKVYDASASDIVTEHEEQMEIVKDVPEGTTLKDVLAGRVTMQEFVASLSLEELAALCSGVGGYAQAPSEYHVTLAVGAPGYTTSIMEESKGIPATAYVDGPSGARLNREFVYEDQTYYQYVTCIPAGSVYSQSWDENVIKLAGDIVGRECEQYGATYILEPGLNIVRDPLCGRNYEYYSEDPSVCGNSATAFIDGVQQHKGISVSPKHFAGNNQETARTTVNTSATERTLREIYLKGFEILVKNAAPATIMTSYNLLNGTETAENYALVTNILRGEWGYNGLVEVDWGGSNKAMQTIASGNDNIQPGDGADQDLYFGIADAATGIAEVLDDGTLQAGAFNNVAGGEEVILREFDVDFEIPTKLYVTEEINGQDREGNYYARVIESEISKGTASVEFLDADGNATAIADSNAEEGTKLEDVKREDYTAIRISYYGNYDKNTYIYVGEMQRAAMNILRVVMNSIQMGELHEDVEVISYTEFMASPEYDYLRATARANSGLTGENGLLDYIRVEKSEVQ